MSCISVGTNVFDCSPPVDPLNIKIYDFIAFDQDVGIGGSEWVRSLSDAMALTQSDYFIESLSSTLVLIDQAVGVKDLFETIIDPISFQDSETIAGGRQFVQLPELSFFTSDTSKGMAVYVDGDNSVDLARSNMPSTSLVIGLAASSVLAGKIGPFINRGRIQLSDWTAVTGSATLTPGNLYYLDKDVAGGLTDVAVILDGNTVIRVGIAITPTEMQVTISQPIFL